MKKISLLVLLGNFFMCAANVSLPNVISDNMVLQQNSEVALWGWAKPGEMVMVKPSWDATEYKVKVGNTAFWMVKIKTIGSCGSQTISIKENNEIVLQNILLGEVWLCSGQSNMEMPAAWGILNGDEEIKNANYPNIRFFNVPKLSATTPQNNVIGSWTTCTPETMKNFSALAYFYAQKLQKELNVPVGIVLSSWGGIPAEPFVPKEAIEINPITNMEAKRLNPSQWWPIESGSAYNAMIYPFLNFKIAGVLWYQGESNCGSFHYDETLVTLIRTWRALWGFNFPFYYAQIAPYNYGNNTFAAGIIRDAQRKVLSQVDNIAMALTSDCSTTDDIHPKDKKTIAIRMANLAMKNSYKKNISVVNGPLFKNFEVKNNTLIVHFDFSDGLKFKDNVPSTQFELAGEDGIFYRAVSKIEKNCVLLQSENVPKPTKVRFSIRNTDQSDVFNAANLPASTFVSE